MALKNLTKLTRLQLEKDPDRLGVHRVLCEPLGVCTHICYCLRVKNTIRTLQKDYFKPLLP